MVLSAVELPDITGLQLVRRIKRRQPDLPVVLLASEPRVSEAVRAIKLGAADYLHKPRALEDLELSLTSLLAGEPHGPTADEESTEPWSERIITNNTNNHLMRRAINRAVALADVRTPILLEGEPGVGKNLLAREIHRGSRRQRGPFVEVECSALAEYLLASELFGHVRGAFSGAGHDRQGKLEAADGGVVFVNGISEASQALQWRLLRVLEDGVIERLGEGRPVPVNVKMIAATTQDLEELVWDGKFSEPLYHRLNVARIKLPPLRHRREDIKPLTRHFLEQFRLANGRGPREVSGAAARRLEEYAWPGNVAELQSVVQAVAAICREDRIKPRHLPEMLTSDPPSNGRSGSPTAGTSLTRFMEERERELIEQALTATNYNIQRSARLLEISRPTLYSKMKQFGMSREN